MLRITGHESAAEAYLERDLRTSEYSAESSAAEYSAGSSVEYSAVEALMKFKPNF